jgi:hypothetical protein
LEPERKIVSAIFSYLVDFSELLLIERNGRVVPVNNSAATAVHSSIKGMPFNFNTF